jgi:hypothetical protein
VAADGVMAAGEAATVAGSGPTARSSDSDTQLDTWVVAGCILCDRLSGGSLSVTQCASCARD